MSRTARRIDWNGYHHVIMRGVGKQILFEETEDYRFFLNRVRKFTKETGVAVCTYCLMENHVHMLLHDSGGNTTAFMQRLGVSYARYFNEKYDRVGHLFQDRFKSEIVDSESYFCTVVRYILRNPEKAGICPAQAYRWSSFAENKMNEFVELDLIREIFSSRNAFDEYVTTDNTDDCMEFEGKPRDQRALQLIRNEFNVKSGTEIQRYDRESRDEAIRKMLTCGISVRTIERLTGIGRGIVQRIR